MAGRSHGVQALPITFGHKAAIWLSELERLLMKRLGLGVADINWQPARDRFAEYVCVLAIIAQTLGKIANEIITLERTEIGELYEPFSEGKVGSSTMPHKRNPSSCEAVVSVSRALRYNAAYMLECMLVEHERDGSAWRGEAAQAPAGLPQGVGAAKLAEQHRHELPPAGEAARVALGVRPLDQRLELCPREQLEQLAEHAAE